MDIGIGLPATIPWTNAPLILEWAKRADSTPFSSLGILDRLVYPNYEPLITLAAAAAVTERLRLMTTVLIAPLRRAGVLAKQAATIDALQEAALPWGSALEPEKTTSNSLRLPSMTEAASSRSSLSS
jgi:alkanesulfonate monooxygenase SsuD/methylene tetrahydromethanopterin reductase-like flavin-dependent oxidoreductase (luciferase family)